MNSHRLDHRGLGAVLGLPLHERRDLAADRLADHARRHHLIRDAIGLLLVAIAWAPHREFGLDREAASRAGGLAV